MDERTEFTEWLRVFMPEINEPKRKVIASKAESLMGRTRIVAQLNSLLAEWDDGNSAMCDAIREIIGKDV